MSTRQERDFGSTPAEIGEYWDEHDLGEIWDETEPVEFAVDLPASPPSPGHECPGYPKDAD